MCTLCQKVGCCDIQKTHHPLRSPCRFSENGNEGKIVDEVTTTKSDMC